MAKQPCPKTFIFDVDSTLLDIETLDELIRLEFERRKSPDEEIQRVMAEIRAITERGMNGDIPFAQSLEERLRVARIHSSTVRLLRALLLNHTTRGMKPIISMIHGRRHQVLALSGGFFNYMFPALEYELGIDRYDIVANGLMYDKERYVCGVDPRPLLLQNHGKALAVEDLRRQNRIQGPAYMIGDGYTDLETYTHGAVDDFLGFGIHAVHDTVQDLSPYYATTMNQVYEWIEERL